MRPIITLTTDLGTGSTYVAATKAVILGINPDANIIDVCHIIAPQNLRQASFTVGAVYDLFPAKTIHIVAVDPGVGTRRRGVIVKTPKSIYVAPDNGVLSHVSQRQGADLHRRLPRLFRINLPSTVTAVHITKSRLCRVPVSPTFHGRDIFVPVASRLSPGLGPHEFGDRVDTLTALPLIYPRVTARRIIGHIQHIDNYGNLVTDITAPDLSVIRGMVTVIVGQQEITGLVTTCAESWG